MTVTLNEENKEQTQRETDRELRRKPEKEQRGQSQDDVKRVKCATT